MEHGRGSFHRFTWIIERRELFVFDIDQTHSFFGGLLRFRGNGGYPIADKANYVPAEHRHIADLLADITILRVCPGNDGFDSRNGARSGNIDANDLRVRVRTAENLSP